MTLQFSNIKEFLTQVRSRNYRLGVVRGFIYADPAINAFIADKANSDIIIFGDTVESNLQTMMLGGIDGFIADSIVGSVAELNNHTVHGNDPEVIEILLNASMPVHFMFSKKTVPFEVVREFNDMIARFITTDRYKEIMSYYLYPNLLHGIIDAELFHIIGSIGVIAFAFSGVIIAIKENATLFKALILAALPPIGTCIRDVIIHLDRMVILSHPEYMYYIIAIVLIGLILTRVFNNIYQEHTYHNSFITKLYDSILIVCDAVGQSAFIVTGVKITLMANVHPIELWGPFFAFLTANGGVVAQNLIRKDRVAILGGAEISLLWGFILSVYLSSIEYNANDEMIYRYTKAVITIMIGAFITRMAVYYLKLPNLRFR